MTVIVADLYSFAIAANNQRNTSSAGVEFAFQGCSTVARLVEAKALVLESQAILNAEANASLNVPLQFQSATSCDSSSNSSSRSNVTKRTTARDSAAQEAHSSGATFAVSEYYLDMLCGGHNHSTTAGDYATFTAVWPARSLRLCMAVLDRLRWQYAAAVVGRRQQRKQAHRRRRRRQQRRERKEKQRPVLGKERTSGSAVVNQHSDEDSSSDEDDGGPTSKNEAVYPSSAAGQTTSHT